VPNLATIQIATQFWSLILYTLLAVWFVRRWLKSLGRADALIVVISVHLFRYVALSTFLAQHDGYPISDTATIEAVIGDIAGAVIALAAAAALWGRRKIGIALCWLLVIETVADFVVGLRRKALEPLWGMASGTTWLMLNFYVTLIIVSVPVLIWQLYARRQEPLDRRVGKGAA
jgi:hypothetical protein